MFLNDREPLPLYSSAEDAKAGKPVAYAHWDEVAQAWTTPPIGPVRVTVSGEMPMIKCPGCDMECDEEDFPAQAAHMLEAHPDIVAQRQAEAARFDGWERDD